MNAVTIDATTGDRFLRREEVIALTGYKKSAIYAMMARGEFPQQHQIGPNRVVWLEGDIKSWMARRLESTDRPPARNGMERVEPERNGNYLAL